MDAQLEMALALSASMSADQNVDPQRGPDLTSNIPMKPPAGVTTEGLKPPPPVLLSAPPTAISNKPTSVVGRRPRNNKKSTAKTCLEVRTQQERDRQVWSPTQFYYIIPFPHLYSQSNFPLCPCPVALRVTRSVKAALTLSKKPLTW